MNPSSKLIDLARAAHAAKPRRLVTVADILATVHKESGGVPIFTGSEILFKQNTAAAAKITGIPAAQIIKFARIESGEFRGEISKFRCEPGYWEWSKKFTRPADEEFLLACSFGLGQKMARWLVANTPEASWIPTVKKFMGDQALQLLYVAGDLDQLMAAARGHQGLSAAEIRQVAYTRYNEGVRLDRLKKPVARISDYGRAVEKLRVQAALIVGP